MKVSVIIPAYNEIDTLALVLERVRATPIDKEIILVDDGSTDGTAALARTLEDRVDRLVFHSKNRGKGAAVRSGLELAVGDVILIQDADLEYDPADYERLLKPLADGQADVVFGSRFSDDQQRPRYFSHWLGNHLLTRLSNAFTRLDLTDMEVGYKAFRREILERIELVEDRFGFEPEFTAKIARLGCRVFEVGVSYRGRRYSEGKKVSWPDGLRAIWCILKYNLFART